MQIHVVRPGDTLWRISQTYNVPMNELISSNEIPNPNQLVVGQTIVIPIWGSYHWVRPGETLYSISRIYNVSVQELIRINRITRPEAIQPGTRLYIPQPPRPTVDTGAYIDPRMSGTTSPSVVSKVADNLTYLTVFSYAVKRDGSLTPVNDTSVIAAAYQHRTVPLLVITNFEGGTFSTELATTILSSDELQNRVLDNAIAVMEQKGYLGLDVDFEYLGAANREKYNAFMRKAALRLHARNYILSAALAPKLSADVNNF